MLVTSCTQAEKYWNTVQVTVLLSSSIWLALRFLAQHHLDPPPKVPKVYLYKPVNGCHIFSRIVESHCTFLVHYEPTPPSLSCLSSPVSFSSFNRLDKNIYTTNHLARMSARTNPNQININY